MPVLTYHRVHSLRPGANAIETDLTVDPRSFFEEMAAIKRAGYHSITAAQLYGALYRGGRLPSKPVLLTVDDGYVDDVRAILPVLRRDGFTALFNIITSRFHEPGFLTAAQVRELDRAGMDIGSHTVSHQDLTAMSGAKLASEVTDSKRALERVLDHSVSIFCYPSGRFDESVVAAVRRAGYALAFTTEYGTSISSRAPLTIPRLHVGRSATPSSVVALLGG